MNNEGVAAAASKQMGLDALTWIGFSADLAAIATAIVAVWVWLWFRRQRTKRRNALEGYLKDMKSAGDDFERRTVLHLMAHLRMTEAHIFEAAFDSEHVVTSPGQDNAGIANRIYFQYRAGDSKEDLKLTGRGMKRQSPLRSRAR